MKACPNCKLINPPEAVRCDCGYNFVSKKANANLQTKAPKIVYWISAGLLLGCGLFLFIFLWESDWSQFSPQKMQSVTSKLTAIIIRTLVCAGLVAWVVKRKGYRLLTFSIVCTIMTIIGAYYFHVGKQEAEQKQESTVKVDH
jgi:cytochrome bd-type quinol oxidase subunit 2